MLHHHSGYEQTTWCCLQRVHVERTTRDGAERFTEHCGKNRDSEIYSMSAALEADTPQSHPCPFLLGLITRVFTGARTPPPPAPQCQTPSRAQQRGRQKDDRAVSVWRVNFTAAWTRFYVTLRQSMWPLFQLQAQYWLIIKKVFLFSPSVDARYSSLRNEVVRNTEEQFLHCVGQLWLRWVWPPTPTFNVL